MASIDKQKEKLEQILNAEEYQKYYEDNRNFLQVWWENAVEWIQNQLGDISSTFEPSNNLANIILYVIILAIILLIVIGTYFLSRSMMDKRKYREQPILQSISEKDWTFHDHLEEAQQQENNKNYTNAIRHLFLALLLFLNEEKLIQVRMWKTNGEYFNELKKISKETADEFYQLALQFDEAFYGEQPLNKEEYDQYRNKVLLLIKKRNNEVSM